MKGSKQCTYCLIRCLSVKHPYQNFWDGKNVLQGIQERVVPPPMKVLKFPSALGRGDCRIVFVIIPVDETH